MVQRRTKTTAVQTKIQWKEKKEKKIKHELILKPPVKSGLRCTNLN